MRLNSHETPQARPQKVKICHYFNLQGSSNFLNWSTSLDGGTVDAGGAERDGGEDAGGEDAGGEDAGG